MFKNIEAVIFDLDGTLVDSMWMWKQIDIDYLEKYTFGLQYGWDLVSGYTCMDDNESIYKSKTNQWIIEIKYVNINDGKEYVKKFITPLNSELNRIQLKEYKEPSNGISNIILSKKKAKLYNIFGNNVPESYKGIVIKEGIKFIKR